ncbi:MAG: FMN-binding protein [Candidatus Omnitrophota bacterium]
MSLVISLLLFPAVSFAEVYIAREEAAKKIFPSQERYTREKKAFDNQPVEVFTFFKEGKVIGWAVALDEMGKIKPITFLVGINAQGKVADVYVLEYRDMFGLEIKRKSFMKQFKGKALQDPIKIGKDIDAVTQATISSRAASAAVRKSLQIVEELREKL